MSVTLKDVKREKRFLEQEIEKLVVAYEEYCGVPVDVITIQKTDAGPRETTDFVDVKLKI